MTFSIVAQVKSVATTYLETAGDPLKAPFHLHAGEALQSFTRFTMGHETVRCQEGPTPDEALARLIAAADPTMLTRWEERLAGDRDIQLLMRTRLRAAAVALYAFFDGSGTQFADEAKLLWGEVAMLLGLAQTTRPYEYQYSPCFEEPDWQRIPGYHDVTPEQWEDATWQRRHTIKTVAQLKATLGEFLTDEMITDLERDMREHATMMLLVPPQMINTMNEQDLGGDPIRRYMIPLASERHPLWPSHPLSRRDSLHEAEMYAVPGLTHRYPTKVLFETLLTCPQSCGHCTRMDAVLSGTPQVPDKLRFEMKPDERYAAVYAYLREHREVRDVVVSGGDIGNLPPRVLEEIVATLLDIDHIRDIRLASKALMALPQHFLQDEVLGVMERLAKKARERGVSLALHTHINHPNQVTPLVAKAAKRLLELGFRDVRNQGVLLRGVNDSLETLLKLCYKLLDHAGIMPYYFYMCDMIPGAEHWRPSLAAAQALQSGMMGYLPGFATPRIVCDVPRVGKRWVHQATSYDPFLGISYWMRNYAIETLGEDASALSHLYPFYDPLDTLPEEGQRFWEQNLLRA